MSTCTVRPTRAARFARRLRRDGTAGAGEFSESEGLGLARDGSFVRPTASGLATRYPLAKGRFMRRRCTHTGPKRTVVNGDSRVGPGKLWAMGQGESTATEVGALMPLREACLDH